MVERGAVRGHGGRLAWWMTGLGGCGRRELAELGLGAPWGSALPGLGAPGG